MGRDLAERPPAVDGAGAVGGGGGGSVLVVVGSVSTRLDLDSEEAADLAGGADAVFAGTGGAAPGVQPASARPLSKVTEHATTLG